MVFNCFGMLIAEIVSAPQGIPVVTLLIFALSLYPVGLMLGGSSCQGCCDDEGIDCEPCYRAYVGGSTGIGRFSREQECLTCRVFKGTWILRRCRAVYQYTNATIRRWITTLPLGPSYDLRPLLQEGPNRDGQGWHGFVPEWGECTYTSELSNRYYGNECVFRNGQNVWENAGMTVIFVGPMTYDVSSRKWTIEIKAIAGKIRDDYEYYGLYRQAMIWCSNRLGLDKDWEWGFERINKERKCVWFHGPVTPDENGNFSVTMNFTRGPIMPPSWFFERGEQDCSGSITITNIPNPILDPNLPTRNCRPCVSPYPGVEFFKNDWNEFENFGLTQTSISFSGARPLTNPEICSGADFFVFPRWCLEGDCQCSQWDGKGPDLMADPPETWEDHVNYVPMNCDGFNKTIVLDFATYTGVINASDWADYYGDRFYPGCVRPSCLVKEDGTFVGEDIYGFALCEDIGYDSIVEDPSLCILDDTPICPRPICNNDNDNDGRKGCACLPGLCLDNGGRSVCYDSFVPAFRVLRCARSYLDWAEVYWRSDKWWNPFGVYQYYADPCAGVYKQAGYNYSDTIVPFAPGTRAEIFEPERCEYDEALDKIFIDGCPYDHRSGPSKITSPVGDCYSIWSYNPYHNTGFCVGEITKEFTYS